MPGFKLRVFASMFLALLLTSGTGSAQTVTGAIVGRVTDATGAVIAGATIQLQNVDTGFSRAHESDSGGRYVARSLPIGPYTITVRHPGFSSQVRSGVTLTVGSEAVVDFELAIGEVQQEVQITAEAPLIESTTASLSGLVGHEQMRDLPLNGRNYHDLALLTPGVAQQHNAGLSVQNGTGVRLSSNGARLDSNTYLLDGTVVNDASGHGPGGAGGNNLGVEAIQEFRVLTHNFSAEYGRGGGAILTAVTRSGTNNFHGSVYEFVRNNIFDARNYFNPGDLPPFKRNQFGASAGGPLKKDRVFFFANFEGVRERRGTTVIANVPDANARNGLVPCSQAAGFACGSNGLANVGVAPRIAQYLQLWPSPTPNGRNFGNGIAQSITDVSTRGNDDYYMARMDFTLSSSDNLYARYIFSDSDQVLPDTTAFFSLTAAVKSHFAVISETHIFSPTIVNDFRFGFNRTANGAFTGPLDFGGGNLGFLPNEGVGTINFAQTGDPGGSLSGVGTNSSSPQYYPQNVFQFTDNLGWVKGAHSMKFGLDIQKINMDTERLSFRRGVYRFGGLIPLLQGTPNQLQFSDATQSNPLRQWRQTLYGWYAQDDFQLKSNLTLNLGLRHEFVTGPRELSGLSASLRNITDPISTLGPPFVTDKNLFAPRLGIVWDPFKQGKTAVRAGVGIFYGHLFGRNFYFFTDEDARFTKRFVVNNPPNFPNATLSGASAGGSQATTVAEFDQDTPTFYHYNLQVQQQLAPTISLNVGYVGSQARHLAAAFNQGIRRATICPASPCPAGSPAGAKFWGTGVNTPPFVNPSFSAIRQLRTVGSSNYNALQLVLNKAFSHGLMLTSNYTWSKFMSNSDSTSSSQTFTTAPTPIDVDNIQGEYALSGLDRRHALVLSTRYRLPFDQWLPSQILKTAFGGWEINGIYQASSGYAFNIKSGFNNSRSGDIDQTDRPNMAPGFTRVPTSGTTAGCTGVPAGQELGTPEMWFDPCAFELPPAGFHGNSRRNMGTGPGFSSLNLGLMKDFPITESVNLQFRAEAFNALNHANFLIPSVNVFQSTRQRTTTAGVITGTANNNREMQLSLKLIF